MKIKIKQQENKRYAIYRKWLFFWIIVECGFDNEYVALSFANRYIETVSKKERANIYKVETIYKSNPSTIIGMD